MVERTIAWLVTEGNRRVRYRGVERNQHGLATRVAAVNLRRLVNLGLDHSTTAGPSPEAAGPGLQRGTTPRLKPPAPPARTLNTGSSVGHAPGPPPTLRDSRAKGGLLSSLLGGGGEDVGDLHELLADRFEAAVRPA